MDKKGGQNDDAARGSPVWLIVVVFLLPALLFLAGNVLGTWLLSWLAVTPIVNTFLISLVWMSAQRSYSLLMFFAFFVLGYLVLSSPDVQNTLERCRLSHLCGSCRPYSLRRAAPLRSPELSAE
ncbi:MAG TPA: hypothetical protein O0X38_07335 [Methanocorpusculum sp.]|nr:hypothetical protein [Methanocorpusculum sp.]